MLKHIMGFVLRSPDANTDGTSSDPSKDAQGDSSTQQDDQQQSDGDDTAQQGDDQTDDDADSSDGTDGDADQGQSNDQQQQGADDEAAPAVTDKPEDAQLEFHKHPRFQEVIKEKNTYKEKIASLEPAAQRAAVLDNYLSSNGIAPQDFTNALEFLRLVKTNPAQAMQQIKPTYEALQMLNGERLPQDLEAQVAAGMNPETAKELARLRVQANRQQGEQQNVATIQQQFAEQMISQTWSTWDQTKRATDPDFKPKTDQNAPDGKWELVDMKLRAARATNPPRTPQEAMQMVEQAYNEVNRFFAARKPQRRAALPSRNSSQNSSPVVKTANDVVKAIMAGKRPNELKYS